MNRNIIAITVVLACATAALASDQVWEPQAIRILDAGVNAAPVRAVADWLGAALTYNADDGAITMSKDGRTVALRLYVPEYTVDGVSAKFAVAPFVCDNAAYAPVRALAEPFGCEVLWDGDADTRSAIVTRKDQAGELRLPVTEDLQTLTADFDGDGTNEVAYTSCLNSHVATWVDKPCIAGLLWIVRGQRELWSRVVPNEASWHVNMRAYDITGDSTPDIILEGEYWGSGENDCFGAFGWNGRAYGPLLAEGTLYHSGMGEAFVLPQGRRKPARLATIDIVFDNQHRPDCFVADWYDWNGHQFVKTRTRTTRKNHGIDCKAACRELGLPKPG